MIDNSKIKEEFSKIKYFVYFDWNIIIYILDSYQNLNVEVYQKAFCLNLLLDQYINRELTCFPYSHGHLQDIIQGTEQYRDKKIEILQNISNSWFISEDKSNNELIRIDKCLDFKEHISSTIESEEVLKYYQNLFFPLIKNNFQNDENRKIYDSFSLHDYDDFNLSCMHIVKSLLKKGSYINGERYFFNRLDIDVYKLSKENILKKINDCLKKSSWPFKNFDEYERYMRSLLFVDTMSNIHFKVFIFSFLCDLVGITSEKLDKKTSFKSMLNDTFHLSIGLRLENFVTEDKILRKKAIVCKKLLGCDTKLFSIDNFIKYILQVYTKNNFPEEKYEYSFIKENFFTRKYGIDVNMHYYV